MRNRQDGRKLGTLKKKDQGKENDQGHRERKACGDLKNSSPR